MALPATALLLEFGIPRLVGICPLVGGLLQVDEVFKRWLELILERFDHHWIWKLRSLSDNQMRLAVQERPRNQATAIGRAGREDDDWLWHISRAV